MTISPDGIPFSVAVVGAPDLTGARRVLLRASASRVLRGIAEGVAPLAHLRAQSGGEVRTPRIASSLANESERLVVEEALAAGYDLTAILPSPATTYIDCFVEPTDRERVAGLLARANEVVGPSPFLQEGPNTPQMVGAPDDLGLRLLAAADLLIPIWSGNGTSGSSVEGRLAVAAAEQGIPVVWIDTAPPHGIHLYGLTEPHPEAWNRILPPDVLQSLEKMATPAPVRTDHSTYL